MNFCVQKWKEIEKRNLRKFLLIKYFVLLNISCVLFLIFFVNYKNSRDVSNGDDLKDFLLNENSELLKNKRHECNWTRILYWTSYFGDYSKKAAGIKDFPMTNCPLNCIISFDKDLLHVAEGVIFHIRDLDKSDKLPTKHEEDQIWIFYIKESPEYTLIDLSLYQNTFNWTMTYRADSDIFSPYGKFIPIQNPAEKVQISSNNDNANGKNKELLVAWIVSHCNTISQRETYVKELKEYIPVDIYGKCGAFSCPQNISCYKFISTKYKFYLSFENSLCTDYITEKFFNALKYNIVPIVYGGGNYSLYAPPNSYINARDFSSPKELAKYLYFLNQNFVEYSKYFEWKSIYKIQSSNDWCSLCSKLKEFSLQINNGNAPKKSIYENIKSWWEMSPNPTNTNSSHSSLSNYNPICQKIIVSSIFNMNTIKGRIYKIFKYFF